MSAGIIHTISMLVRGCHYRQPKENSDSSIGFDWTVIAKTNREWCTITPMLLII